MKLDKEIIKRSFSRAASTYDDHAAVQKSVALELVSFFEGLNKASRILDVGCGTGVLLGPVKELYPDSQVFGTDIAHTMLIRAKEKSSTENTKLVTSECEFLPVKEGCFDLVISSLTYQWALDLKRAFKEAERILTHKGLFVFSTLGPGTLKELRSSVTEAENINEKNGLPPFMNFQDKESISTAIKKAGLELVKIENRTVIKTYKNLSELLRTLKSIGASNPSNGGVKTLGRGHMLKEVFSIYKDKFPSEDGAGIKATYDVIFAVARKG